MNDISHESKAELKSETVCNKFSFPVINVCFAPKWKWHSHYALNEQCKNTKMLTSFVCDLEESVVCMHRKSGFLNSQWWLIRFPWWLIKLAALHTALGQAHGGRTERKSRRRRTRRGKNKTETNSLLCIFAITFFTRVQTFCHFYEYRIILNQCQRISKR